MSLKDTKDVYGRVSRALHWGMALLLLWQFLSAISHFFFEDSAMEAFFWPTHKPLGFLLLLLIIIRIVWAFANMGRRPAAISGFAKLGHILLYLMMLTVPTLALLRQYGSGRSFEPFGIPLFGGFEGEKIQWMIDLGSLLHGELGWVLLALTIGHIAMAIWHKKSGSGVNVISRMWGK